ncbi:MAG: gfo/Idh/MocA family oxidoreductase [Chloroflexota bacterium]|nr:MAG: gfo/Idh/MocA family oxidoreductase [Chloroflexota bacterium]
MAKDIYTIGVAGAGMWGKIHIDMLKQSGRARVKWVCNRSLESSWAAAAEMGIERAARDFGEITQDPEVDVVVIASPPYTHAAMTVDALRHGKHVLLEKPLALNPGEAAAIVAEAEKHPELVVLEGSGRHTRLNPKFLFVKSLIDSGRLGRIYHIHHNHLMQGTFIEYNPKGAWAMDRALAAGGPVMDWGEYDLSFHLGLLDDKPELCSLKSFSIGGLRSLGEAAPNVDVEMHAAAYMEFSGGLSYYYERGAGVHLETRCETRLYGTQGGLRFYYTTWEPNTVELFYAGEKPAREVFEVDMSGYPANDNLPFLAHFFDCLDGKAEPVMPVALAAKHFEILYKILREEK